MMDRGTLYDGQGTLYDGQGATYDEQDLLCDVCFL